MCSRRRFFESRGCEDETNPRSRSLDARLRAYTVRNIRVSDLGRISMIPTPHEGLYEQHKETGRRVTLVLTVAGVHMLLAAPSTGLQLLPQGVVISGLPHLDISRSSSSSSTAISGSKVLLLLLLLLGERAERAEE